jgi:hypothetical protein
MAVPRRLLEMFPDVTRLASLTAEDAIALLAKFGVELDLAALEDTAKAAFARAKAAARAGVLLDATAMAALEGAVQRALDSALRESLRAIIGGWRESVIAGGEPPTRLRELWVAVMDTSTCTSCEDRHGEERTRAEWQLRGMPRSEALICRRKCRCELFPVTGDAPDMYVEVASL